MPTGTKPPKSFYATNSTTSFVTSIVMSVSAYVYSVDAIRVFLCRCFLMRSVVTVLLIGIDLSKANSLGNKTLPASHLHTKYTDLRNFMRKTRLKNSRWRCSVFWCLQDQVMYIVDSAWESVTIFSNTLLLQSASRAEILPQIYFAPVTSRAR